MINVTDYTLHRHDKNRLSLTGGFIAMQKANVVFHPAYQVSEISPRLFGAFLEPLGSLVDGSMYNPEHPTADEEGFRQDYMEALRKSGLPAVRLPGGNFVSGWDWKGSIGPKDQRKAQLDLAWCRYETNAVGLDEYLRWSEKVGFEPLYTINLGTDSLKDAIHLVEYTTHEGGTYWSDLRKQYGHPAPYGIKTWYLGNEMDGPWQIGSRQKDPVGYGAQANEVAKAIKWIHPDAETIVSMSAMPSLPTYPQWDMDVLQQCYDTVDYISLHHYYSAPPGDYDAQLAASDSFEDVIRTRIALCDFIQSKLRAPRKMLFSFDEYGFMVLPPQLLHYGRGGNIGRDTLNAMIPKPPYRRRDPNDWSTLDIIPGHKTTMVDALVNISVLMTLIRHADRVKIGCMTSGLAALATTDRDHVWKSITHYPYTQLIENCKGISLQPSVTCETYDVPGYANNDFDQYDDRHDVKLIEAAASYDEKDGKLNLFIINRSWKKDIDLDIDVSGFKGYRLIDHTEMFSDDPDAVNTWEQPDRVLPQINTNTTMTDGIISVKARKLSWNMFRLEKA